MKQKQRTCSSEIVPARAMPPRDRVVLYSLRILGILNQCHFKANKSDSKYDVTRDMLIPLGLEKLLQNNFALSEEEFNPLRKKLRSMLAVAAEKQMANLPLELPTNVEAVELWRAHGALLKTLQAWIAEYVSVESGLA